MNLTANLTKEMEQSDLVIEKPEKEYYVNVWYE